MATKFKNISVIIIVLFTILVITHKACIAEQQANEQLNSFHSENPVGSDAYLVDSISYIHPDWEYEQVEDYIFMNSDAYEALYKEPK